MRRTVHVHVFDGHADWEIGMAEYFARMARAA